MSSAALEEKLTITEVRDLWPVLSTDERVEAFSMLDRKTAKEFFLSLSPQEMVTILIHQPEDEKVFWIRLLPPDDAADLIQASPEELRMPWIDLLDHQSRKEVRALLDYKQDVAGGLMNPHFARVRPDQTAEEAIRYLRFQAQEHLEGIYYIYALDEGQRLKGAISFRDLFKAAPDKKVQEIMTTPVVSVPENMDQEAVSKLFSHHKFMALPVVDKDQRVKGVITMDDVLHAVQEEATEDIHKMGGVQVLERPYLELNVFEMLKKRAGWLIVLFFGELLTANAMAHFEEEIARAVVLAMFVPLIISSGGNSGSQASTLVIRALALGEVKLRDWWRIMRREIATGFGLGCILATLGFVRILLWEKFFHLYGEHYFLLALSVGISLLGVVMWGSLAGSMLPFILRRLGFDPASASTPFVATLVDVSGIMIYFGASAFILRGTLL